MQDVQNLLWCENDWGTSTLRAHQWFLSYFLSAAVKCPWSLLLSSLLLSTCCVASYGLGQLTLLGQLVLRYGKAGRDALEASSRNWRSFQGKLIEKTCRHLSKGASSTGRNVNDSCVVAFAPLLLGFSERERWNKKWSSVKVAGHHSDSLIQSLKYQCLTWLSILWMSHCGQVSIYFAFFSI